MFQQWFLRGHQIFMLKIEKKIRNKYDNKNCSPRYCRLYKVIHKIMLKAVKN